MSSARLLIQDYAGVTVVTFQDNSILDVRAIDRIAEELYHLVDAQNKQKLILDLSNVRYLASHALGMLITLHKKAKAARGEMVLCGIRAELRSVFSITNLDKILRIFEDDAAALKHFHVHVR